MIYTVLIYYTLFSCTTSETAPNPTRFRHWKQKVGINAPTVKLIENDG